MKKSKAEIYRIRYAIYRDLGYTAKEARALRGKALDVSQVKTDKKSGRVIKGKIYRNIRNSMGGPAKANKFVNRAWRVKNDTIFSRWGMLTQDDRYKDDTAKIVNWLKKQHGISTDQAYYFLYYMTSNKIKYDRAKSELLSSREFEEYDRAKLRRKYAGKMRRKERRRK